MACEVLLLLGAVALEAQPRSAAVRHVSGNVSCPACSILVTEGASIGEEDGDGILGGQPDVVLRLINGSFIIAGESGDERVPRVFDSRGRFARRIGRLGSGPGEYRRVNAGMLLSDTLFLFDDGNARMTVLRPDFSVERSSPVPGRVLWAQPLGSDIAVSTRTISAAGTAFPVHRFDRAGAHLGPLGDSAETLRGRFGIMRYHVLGATSRGTLWTAPSYGEYVIREWTSDGRVARAFDVHSAWNARTMTPQGVSPDLPPHTQMTQIWEDSDGLVWVLAWTADPKWREGLGAPIRDGSLIAYSIPDMSRVWDTMLEVIDPQTGRVITRRRLDSVARWVLSEGVIGQWDEEGDSGFPVVRTFNVRLTGYRRP